LKLFDEAALGPGVFVTTFRTRAGDLASVRTESYAPTEENTISRL
jgi:hypothetical protein